jgi:hypothetical protein
MAATWRRGALSVLILVAVCGTGCNVLSVPFFLFGPEPKEEPMLKAVASKDKDKDVKVVVLTYGGLETRPEFLRADRDLTIQVVKQLREAFKYNEEKVTVVAPSKVDEFKNSHPNWKSMELADIGKRFDADYVIYLEINKLTLYEPGSSNLLYHGRADVTVNLVDVNQPDDAPESKELTAGYPGDSRGSMIPVDDMTPQAFKAAFFTEVATQIAWHFAAHPTSDSYRCR